jgi:hypothetical protein
LGDLLQENLVAQYVALTDYSKQIVTIYGPGGSSRTINLPWSPNDVVLYHDVSTNKCLLFVSSGSVTQIALFQYGSLAQLESGNPSDPTPSFISFPDPLVGMAIQPGTGHLYAQDYTGAIYVCFNNDYATTSQFATGLPPVSGGTGGVGSNLAFDLDGNLWQTSFNGGAGQQVLTCYTNVGNATGNPAGDASKFIQFVNPAAPSFPGIALSGGSATGLLFPLSQPNGIAFDPAGNLWIANNNDFGAPNTTLAGATGKADGGFNTTLLRLSSTWIRSIINNPSNIGTTQPIPPETQGAPSANAYVVPTGAKFGSVYFDGWLLFVEDEGKEVVETLDTSLITDANTAPQGLSFPANPVIVADYPGNGGLVIFNSTPPTFVIRDILGDAGGVVTLHSGQHAYESPDIAVIQPPSQPSLAPPTPSPYGGANESGLSSSPTVIHAGLPTPTFIQVRVANIGGGPSTGTEILKVYWAFAATGLGWPAPWDGEYPATGFTVPGGGMIGAVLIPKMTSAPQQEAVLTLEWPGGPPDPAGYGDAGHFCLLARIEANSLYPFDMTTPEVSDALGANNALSRNVLNNSTIAWRNITILPGTTPKGPPIGGATRLSILGGNYGLRETTNRFALELLDRDGRPTPIEGVVTVHAEGPVRERLLACCADDKSCRHLGNGRFHLHDFSGGLSKIRLEPREVFPFRLTFEPKHAIDDFVMRVVQYVEMDGKEEVLGGQTFVSGHVHGFPTLEGAHAGRH